MRKRLIAVGSIGVVGYILRNKENREKLKDKFRAMLERFREAEKEYSTIEQAGIPDQLDKDDLAQLENAKMVSEGSQYGVNYYNEQVQEEEEERKRSTQ